MGYKSGRFTFLTSLITTSALWVGVAAAAPSVDVGNATPDNTGKAVVTVSLTSNGGSVGGMQNTIVFDNTILTLTTANCTINPAIGLSPGGADCTSDTTVGPCKNLSKAIHQCGATPEPQGCPSGAGANLSALTAIIAATAAPNTNSIPDGTLYTCTFTVANAAGLPATLTNSNIVTSDPTGHQLCSSSGTPCGGTNGTISSGGVTPSPTTPTPVETTPTAVPTTPVPSGPAVNVGSANPDTNNKAAVTVTLASAGASVGGMQNTIVFDNTILTLTTANCTINPAIGLNPGGADCTSDTTVGPCKNLSKAIHQCGATPEPQGCPSGAGANLSALTAIIAATAAPNTNAIPDGDLYTCTFTVANAGALPATLTNSNIVLSDPTGHQICSSTGETPCAGTNGQIGSGPPPPTNTTGVPPTPTNTTGVPPTATNTTSVPPTATNTPAATSTKPPATNTPGGSPAPTSSGGQDNDGCQIGTVGGGSGWLLLVPAVGLLIMRRRRR